ncbi:bestrophin family ion channel [Aureispira sp. CCB-E]|uniref:bestrophin family protein n=1 Tax=Aureispira sp. CCB-E TaxID=3051121 RepID=UPI0028697BA3|nr:bestrophin family ion channel [Aureispira sp. CCB-E]WMX16736.1 bestrophin family ion channel [Aureispira sp. CCB-E]
MHAGRQYSLLHTLFWTSKYILIFAIWSTIVVLLYSTLEIKWIGIPWLPIALVGTAIAFYLGFKNNSAYDRLWEARKIWGGIVNSSRTLGVMARDFVTNEYANERLSQTELQKIHRRLIYRHIAWLYALTFQLREPKPWEHNNKKSAQNRMSFDTDPKPERYDYLKQFISTEDFAYISSKTNRAVQLLSLQSKDLKELKSKGLIDNFRHMEMKGLIEKLYALQGKCERIKNYPFPRQYASVNVFFVWLFSFLLPFAMVHEFSQTGGCFIWLTVPLCVVVSWVFHTMEVIGDFSENPFEGLFNDVPMTSLSRTIEIDLREMLDETDLPVPIKPVTKFKILL